jgi:uncharacterized protein YprB with RNaseH-like and TPR domain
VDKNELWKRYHTKCKHFHNLVEHPNCKPVKEDIEERLGFIDAEMSGLIANFAFVLSYQIYDEANDRYLGRVVGPNEIKKHQDRLIVKECISDILKFDRIIGYYSKRFDIPFLRSRAVHFNLDFPQFDTLHHTDCYDLIKRRFRLNSNRQETACRFLLGSTEKTHLDGEIWNKALLGDKKSLDYIFKHNQADVRDLYKLYNKVRPYSRVVRSSI